MADTLTATYDPRPELVEGPDATWLVAGRRCTQCRYPTVVPVPCCPVCGGATAEDRFGPTGVVSASTCLHVRIPGRTPPYAVAYVDLDDGPRVFVHTDGLDPVAPGSRLTLGAVNGHGDLTAVTA